MAPRDDERGVAERLDDAKGGGGGAERATHRAGDADATMRKRGRDGEAKGNDAGGGGGRSGGDKGRGSGGGGGGKDLMDLFACPPSTDDYVCVGGLRLVRPYPFDFVCHVKKRLEGLNVVDMFAREFPARPRSYYEAAHRAGLLRVEPMPNARGYHHKASAKDKDGTGKSADVSTPRGEAVPAVAPLRPLRAGERVRHALHRHEPPALDIPVTVLAETPEMVAVHKPATVPVHPTGQYRKNTVVGILAAERPDLGRLLPVHRLDKNVSGLLLMDRRASSSVSPFVIAWNGVCSFPYSLARTSAAANSLREQVQGHEVRKEYLALVPSTHVRAGWSVASLFFDGHGNDLGDGYRVCETPEDVSTGLKTVTVTAGVHYDERRRIATCSTDAAPVDGAKEATTMFNLVAIAPDAFNLPVAPAAADSNGPSRPPLVPSLPRGTALVRCRPLTGRTHQIRVHLAHLGFPIANDATYGGHHPGDRARGEKLARVFGELTVDEAGGGDGGEWPLCAHCPRVVHGAGCVEGTEGKGGEARGEALRPHDLEQIWLHCSKYTGASWSFQCPDPPWALRSLEQPRTTDLSS